ncbi:DUF2160 domain-containing protein [Luminiphilus sp. nBUS_16]|uniref:DUF2160 domain-containing protein n=1 Tax=unclassified Luminiphilus TaxID=2633198 RepID=UPI003EB84E65
MTSVHWRWVYGITACTLCVGLGVLFISVPRGEDGLQWTQPLVQGGWMAWTFPVALFFYGIGAALVVFSILAIRFPETPRRGILGMRTTRGDRLFVTLLGSAFINLGWLFFFGAPLTGAAIVCLLFALIVFRWV